MKRCFVAIDIPKKVKEEIVKVQKQIPEFYGKLTEIENLHLTLKFLGEISEDKVEEVRKALRKIKFNNFEASIGSIGFFSENFIRIVWLHLSGFEELQRFVEEALGNIFPREKRFMSHLTIARVKKIEDKNSFLERLRKIEIPQMKFQVVEFNLKESVLHHKGPIYKIIEKYSIES